MALSTRRGAMRVQAAQHAHMTKAILDQWNSQASVRLHVARHDQHLGAHTRHPLNDDLDQRLAAQLEEGLVASHPPAGPTRQHQTGDLVIW